MKVKCCIVTSIIFFLMATTYAWADDLTTGLNLLNNCEKVEQLLSSENHTVVNYRDAHLPRKAPYILGMIKLDGAETPFVHIVEGIEPENVEIGMRVKAVFADKTTNTILDIDHFAPIEE